jgi:hypothetical protein
LLKRAEIAASEQLRQAHRGMFCRLSISSSFMYIARRPLLSWLRPFANWLSPIPKATMSGFELLEYNGMKFRYASLKFI